MVTMHRERLNWILAVLTLIVLAITIFSLVQIEGSYREEIRRDIASTLENFASENVLKSPRDIRVDFGKIERLARNAENASSMIRRIYVSKQVHTSNLNEEILLRPFYYAITHVNWREEFQSGDLRREPIRQNGEVRGALYFDLDMSALRNVRIAIAAILAMIVVLLVVLVVRIFSQERVLVATNEILEQNRRELIRLERLSLAGQLTANIFHDIRKPVTNVKHELEDLSEALGGFAGATRPLRNMRDQVELFFDILRDLNIERFVRADQTDEEYVDVNRVLEQAARLVQYERGAVRVHATMQPDLPLVLAHPYRLVQVFSNIILNAYQAMEGKGELNLITSVRNGAKNQSPLVAVEIVDTGPGIDALMQASIFTPFYTTKPEEKGTGLGLYISKTIIEQLGGKIEIESEGGQGCRFIILIPASD
ncbi:MAG: sensor histidine kinase [Candidatus Sumerlaeia bacterium]